MNKKLVIAIASSSLIIILLIFVLMKNIEKKPSKKSRESMVPPTIPVVFASTDIPPRSFIKDSMVTIKQLDPATVPQEHMESIESVVGNVSKVYIKKNRPIAPDTFYKGQRLSYLVPPYKRAVTIITDKLSSVAYLINPGDMVDVVGLFNSDFAGVEVAKTIVQGADVLAIGQNFREAVLIQPGQPGPNFDIATLAVTLPDVEKLLLTVSKASVVRLALRSPFQVDYVKTRGATSERMFSDVAPQNHKIEIYKGTQKIEVEVK